MCLIGLLWKNVTSVLLDDGLKMGSPLFRGLLNFRSLSEGLACTKQHVPIFDPASLAHIYAEQERYRCW